VEGAAGREGEPTRSAAATARELRRRVAVMVVVIAVAVGALLFVSLRSAGDRSAAKVSGRLHIGQPAPDFSATDLAGHRFVLSSLQGHPVVVAFGASWCQPCNEEYPLLVRAASKYPGHLVVVSVMYEDLKNDALRFLHKYGVHWTAIDDSSNVISEAYQVHALPQTFFITSAGIVQTRAFGLTTQHALDGPLNRLLAAR